MPENEDLSAEACKNIDWTDDYLLDQSQEICAFQDQELNPHQKVKEHLDFQEMKENAKI